MTRLRLARRDALGRTRIICFCAATDVAEPEKMSRDEDHSQDKLSRDQDHYPLRSLSVITYSLNT